MTLFFAILLPFAMSWVSRMCGGGPPKIPFGLDQWIYGLPFLFLVPCAWWASPLVYATAVLGKRTGHGRGMDLTTPHLESGSEPEKVERVILWLQPHVHGYAYKAMILWLTQLVLVSGTVFALALDGVWDGNVLSALVLFALAVMPLTKPLAYMAGHLPIWGWQKILKQPTERGEALTGLFDGLALLGLLTLA